MVFGLTIMKRNEKRPGNDMTSTVMQHASSDLRIKQETADVEDKWDDRKEGR